MQMVKKILIIFATLWFGLIYFLPLQQLYFALETLLKEKKIEINESQTHTHFGRIELQNMEVFIEGVKAVSIKMSDFTSFLFYQRLHILELKPNEMFENELKITVDEATLSHSIFAPTTLFVNAKGSFGIAKGTIDLIKRNVRIDFVEAKAVTTIEQFVKHDEKGWYYETNF